LSIILLREEALPSPLATRIGWQSGNGAAVLTIIIDNFGGRRLPPRIEGGGQQDMSGARDREAPVLAKDGRMTLSLAVPHGQPEPESDMVLALQEDIIFGRLASGARLVEDALLARFGGSRHFVRQALDRLERLGLVTKERNKGATVLSLAAAQVVQIYEVRELVQRQAALTIPLPAPAALAEELQAINAEFAGHMQERNVRGVHDANDRFHLRLFGACGNEYLVATIQHYMRLSLPVRAKSLADGEALRVSHAHHRMMIDMLRGRDNWVLAQLCVDHLQPSKRDYLERAYTARTPRVA
jgi:DNA-binding GntR family transcriptional regulator